MILNKGADPGRTVALSEVAKAGKYMVDRVSGPDKQRLRLQEMGVVAGMPVSVLDCGGEGMVVLRIGGGSMALSKGSACHIWVRRRP